MTTETIEFNETKRNNMFLTDPRSIEVNYDENPRQNYRDMKELEDSIEAHGVKVPLTIKNVNGKPTLIHGFRRMTAVLNLIARGVDIGRVPCLPVAKGYTSEDALIDHLTLNSGEPLTPLEIASVYDQLTKFGYSQTEIAKKVGTKQGNVSNILKLSNCTKKMQDYINKGRISPTLAIRLIKENKEDHAVVEKKVTSLLESTKGKKITESVVSLVPRVSKQMTTFKRAIVILKTNGVSAERITQFENMMQDIEEGNHITLATQLMEL